MEAENTAELSDAIEDDDLSDDTLRELGLKPARADTTLDRRKTSSLSATENGKSRTNGSSLPSSSQRFVNPSAFTRSTTNAAHPDRAEVESHRPWADRYGPTNLEDLMIHKKKVTDVQTWLQGKFDGRNPQKLLILKGPAGSGKTTTLSLLAKAMGVGVVPWHNPAISDSGPSTSISAQFSEFLNRGGQFGSLAFDENLPDDNNSIGNGEKQLLVIEEFPATMTRSSSALHSFRSVVLQFLARAKAVSSMAFGQTATDPSPPVVIIISETLLSSSTALSDSLTAHRLFGPEILNHPLVTTMDFNPVAATFMTRALDLVVKKEARDSGRRRTPGPGVISKLAEIGDIRSAVNSLEFLCLRGGDGSEWSGTVAAKAKRVSKDKLTLTETEKNSLTLVSQRESTLDMFHAVGKVVWNKREDPRMLNTRAEPPPKPPDHLMHLYSPKVSEVDIEALLNETGTDIQTYISALHENYILSCHGESFEDSFDGCSQCLSISDVLNPESRPNRRGNSSNPNAGLIQYNVQAGSSDALRQDEISFNVATRGLLFNLPFPVNRAGASLPGGNRGDVFKMFYPASLRLWKPIEEMQGLLELFVHGEGVVPNRATASDPEGLGADAGVANWRSRSLALNDATPHIKSEPSDQNILYPTLPALEDDDELPTIPPPTVTKDTLTLELLPYMTRITAARKGDTTMMEKITNFKPANYVSTTDESPDDEDDDGAANNIRDVGSTVSLRIFGRQGAGVKKSMSKIEAADVGVEKLFNVEDDIVDD